MQSQIDSLKATQEKLVKVLLLQRLRSGVYHINLLVPYSFPACFGHSFSLVCY
jgi:hypothetical protein